MNNVCFASMEEFVGCITACRNAASVLGGTWAVIPRHGDTPAAALQAGLLILSSWDERYEPILEERRGPIVPRCHAMVMETELVQEGAKVARMVALLDEGWIPALAVSDPEYIRVLRRDGIVFLPDVLDERQYENVVPAHLFGVNVSLFGAAHWRKNIMVQAAAFDRARRDMGVSRWTLHLNGQTSRDETYGLWLQTVRIPFVDHGWLDRARYLALVAAMDAGLCASLRESYCHVAADHVALGVPIVASPGIACLGDGPERAGPDDIDGIAAALSNAIADREAVNTKQRRGLNEQARRNAIAARSALHELTSRGRLFAG